MDGVPRCILRSPPRRTFRRMADGSEADLRSASADARAASQGAQLPQ
ncbi:MAG TPA: hypothetical protein DEF41_02550 [Desulfovibrio sp.]|uniref:Uncharacterized protein n=1 Tax=Nitratidesulfovibrio vulgaris (strain ATCC 29579 / DSM 644 / CCUG 34227 / NCIMB 8303 / VKM B-1760 / Hildenborough) TaxID=882 RepID=Q725Z8_NITV2|nr:hypothetical protein DVU_3275 [Nitratidesulfovibrio vulgaris str. Hildenborough]HBW15029.1 hypothetical protein [Desulfovibrio sp.]